MPGFRLNSKNLLLTYPQCGLDKEVALDLLREKLSDFDLAYIVVSREFHKYPEDHEHAGEPNPDDPHLHAFISLKKKYDARNPTCLDLVDPANDTVYHGNYQGARQPKNAREYVIKDGDICEHGEWVERGEKRNRDEAFAEALAAPSREEAEEIIKSKAPRDFFMGFGNITSALDKVFKPVHVDYQSQFDLNDFNLPADFWNWYNANFMVSSPPISQCRQLRGRPSKWDVRYIVVPMGVSDGGGRGALFLYYFI